MLGECDRKKWCVQLFRHGVGNKRNEGNKSTLKDLITICIYRISELFLEKCNLTCYLLTVLNSFTQELGQFPNTKSTLLLCLVVILWHVHLIVMSVRHHFGFCTVFTFALSLVCYLIKVSLFFWSCLSIYTLLFLCLVMKPCHTILLINCGTLFLVSYILNMNELGYCSASSLSYTLDIVNDTGVNEINITLVLHTCILPSLIIVYNDITVLGFSVAGEFLICNGFGQTILQHIGLKDLFDIVFFFF